MKRWHTRHAKKRRRRSYIKWAVGRAGNWFGLETPLHRWLRNALR